jgi:hypothetical protein
MAPFAATNALARLLNGPSPWSAEPESVQPPPPPEAEPDAPSNDVADLRRELEELKRSLQKKKR